MPVAGRAYPPAHQGLVLGLVASREYRDRADPVAGSAVGPMLEMARACNLAFPVAMVFGLFAFVVQEVPQEGSAGEAGGTRPGDDACAIGGVVVPGLCDYLQRVRRAD